MTYLYTPKAGPLAGRTVRVEAQNSFHAEMLIADATGHVPQASEIIKAGGFGWNYPTLSEALEALKA